jgi:hypothetical protein
MNSHLGSMFWISTSNRTANCTCRLARKEGDKEHNKERNAEGNETKMVFSRVSGADSRE